jgi:DNA-binding IclR family transcriptional regulator
VLGLLAEEPEQPMRLADIARRLDMPRATCQTVLLALCERGFAVRHDPAVAYTLGPACVRVGEAAARALPAVDIAADAIAGLAGTTGFPVGVVVRAGDTIQIAHATEGADPFGPGLVLGQSVPLVAPFGAVFAAYDLGAGEDWLGRCDPPLDEQERARYTAALEAIRGRGWAVSVRPEERPDLTEMLTGPITKPPAERDLAARALAHTEYLATAVEPGHSYRITQVSAPIFDAGGAVTLALMVLGPTYDLRAEEIAALGGRLSETARTVTRELGGMTPARADSPDPNTEEAA